MKEIQHYDSELLDEIIHETQKASELIGALRALSQITKKQTLEKCNLAEIITEI